jgi:hypothetical protein
MYKLTCNPKYVYNAPFIMKFEKEECASYDRIVHDIVKTWWGNENKFKADSHGIYSTTSCDAHIMYVAMMLCRMFGKKIPTHFTIEWVPIIHEVAEGFTFDWGKMLSDNLAKQIEDYIAHKSKGEHAPFYMSAYIMDAICFRTPFPLMNWSWTPTVTEPIHIYHSKLWEENEKDCFYEICHNVVIPIHEAIYGHPPPRISEQIMGNLGAIADWYIEESFSYIRVFGCFASPHALPRFLPDRLVCREVSYQTVSAGITKELKVAQKRVWPAYPIQVGIFSLSYFGHAKVEASALDDITLATIEFKKHDPHRVVENHLAQFNMKKYFHEDSPYDKVFRGARSYDEVISRFQSLPEEEQSGFLSFQKHRRSGLPKILQVEQSLNPTSQVTPSSNPKQHDLPEVKTKEVEKTPEILSKDTTITGIAIPGKTDLESLALFEAFMKHGHAFPQLFSNTETPVKDVTIQGESTALAIPIPSLTPLATSSDLPGSEVINIDDMTPIEPEEMPSSDFFFNKKRKAIIRREVQQKGGVVTKRKRMVYDGQGQSDPEFAKQVADSLGAFATTNLWSVDKLREKLDQKNLLIEQLQNDLRQT